MFFFEKKNQKTFVRCRGLVTGALKDAKVFCFFFSKKKTFLSYTYIAATVSRPNALLSTFAKVSARNGFCRVARMFWLVTSRAAVP